VRSAKKKYSSKKLWVGSAAFLLLLVASFFAYKKYTTVVSAAAVSDVAPKIKTIAVILLLTWAGKKTMNILPMVFCDEILTRLSKISAINVLSRTSTLQFRDTEKNNETRSVRQIGGLT